MRDDIIATEKHIAPNEIKRYFIIISVLLFLVGIPLVFIYMGKSFYAIVLLVVYVIFGVVIPLLALMVQLIYDLIYSPNIKYLIQR